MTPINNKQLVSAGGTSPAHLNKNREDKLLESILCSLDPKKQGEPSSDEKNNLHAHQDGSVKKFCCLTSEEKAAMQA